MENIEIASRGTACTAFHFRTDESACGYQHIAGISTPICGLFNPALTPPLNRHGKGLSILAATLTAGCRSATTKKPCGQPLAVACRFRRWTRYRSSCATSIRTQPNDNLNFLISVMFLP